MTLLALTFASEQHRLALLPVQLPSAMNLLLLATNVGCLRGRGYQLPCFQMPMLLRLQGKA